jgi:hypothetical protein
MPNEYRKKARELARLAKSQRDPELRIELRELSVKFALLAKRRTRQFESAAPVPGGLAGVGLRAAGCSSRSP